MISVSVVVVLVLTLLIVWWKRDTDNSKARASWEPPQQPLLSLMSVRPAPGWRTDVASLGVPAGPPGAAERSRIAVSDNPADANAFVGYLGDRAYFIASSPGAPALQWWLIGLDVRDGSRLFTPVQLDVAAIAPNCFLNGPTMIFCLRDDGDLRNNVIGGLAWVVDTATGKVTYTGPTDLRTYPGQHLTVDQVGTYTVAERQNEGVYGVGPQAETTWYVPGAGDPSGAMENLATQTTSGRGSDGKVVFSLADGSVITPDMAAGAQQQTTEIYAGGFVAEVAVDNDLANVEFFDLTGKRTSRASIRGSLARGAVGLPVITFAKEKWAAFTVDGQMLLEVTGAPPHGTLQIGTKLFVDESGDNRFPQWAQYDLTNGAKGKTCDFPMNRYLGTDGSVGVFRVDNPQVAIVAKAMDLTSCETLWELPSEAGSLARVWRINTTLVQLSDDGTELMSLVAPN